MRLLSEVVEELQEAFGNKPPYPDKKGGEWLLPNSVDSLMKMGEDGLKKLLRSSLKLSKKFPEHKKNAANIQWVMQKRGMKPY
jgi:TfoX/Sxy family transcriptional regulator of competence genes